MNDGTTRRRFLQSAAAGGAMLGSTGLSSTGRAQDAESVPAGIVPLSPDIEPLVKLLEETPRSELVEVVAERIQGGLNYPHVLAALLLAGVRNVEPRPSVGFKFHAVLVVQSVHLASLAAAEQDRWLPIFWALDYFKDSQARDERERGWTMAPVDESAAPSADKAQSVFVNSMERWNEPATDAAVASLARTADPVWIWEQFFRLGSRDFRSIGHKVIDVANSHRVLQVIGWQYAEPILRSLAYALLMHENGNPADNDLAPDRPWRRNQMLADRIPDDWQRQTNEDGVVTALVETLRTESDAQAAASVVRLLNDGASPAAIWEAMFVAANELVVRQSGIVALHAMTTTNSMHYNFRMAREDRTRRLILLQNASFLPLFREAMRGRGSVRDFDLLGLEPKPADSVEDIFADVGSNSMAAAQETLGYFQDGGQLEPWLEMAGKLVVYKGTGAHDYKFGYAVAEDAGLATGEVRAHALAGSTFLLQGARKDDNPMCERVRRALGA
jgi:hypothetical protein